MNRSMPVSLLLIALLVAACATTGSSASPAGASAPIGQATDATAATYCTDKGGQIVERVATWNTNGDPSTWLALAGHQAFCEFETGTGDGTTRISVDLTTLSSPEPTLAAIAYLSTVKITRPPTVGANPAEWSCAQDFLGAAAFGNGVAGGGWVDADQPVFVVMIPCTFADGSSIDAFGLWYHANGAIRGADLAPLFAYQPGDRLPAVYQSTGR